MFQRALRRNHDVAPVRQPQPANEHAMAMIGKHSATERMAPRTTHAHAHEAYDIAIEAATRELSAIRYTALPALVAALRRKEMAPLAKQAAVANAAIQLRHMLLSANQHVQKLELGATYADPMILLLRVEIMVLSTRAAKLGAYKGFEDLMPRGYVKPEKDEPQTKQSGAAEQKRVATVHTRVPAKNKFAAAQAASITRAKKKPSSEGPRMPLPRAHRAGAY